MLEAVRKFPDQFQSKFVYNDVALTSRVLKEHLHFTETADAAQERAKEFFIRYIDTNVTITCGEGNADA